MKKEQIKKVKFIDELDEQKFLHLKSLQDLERQRMYLEANTERQNYKIMP